MTDRKGSLENITLTGHFEPGENQVTYLIHERRAKQGQREMVMGQKLLKVTRQEIVESNDYPCPERI